MADLGRPRKPINWIEFDKLVSYQTTQIEVADFFDVSVDTLNNRCIEERGETLSDIWRKRRSIGKIRLRKAQLENVERGAPGWAAMAIYLDKKYFPEERIDLPPPDNANDGTRNVIAIGTGAKTFIEFCVAANYFVPFPKQEDMRAFAFDLDEPRLVLGARGYGKTEYMTIMGTAYDLYLAWFNKVDLDLATNLIITKSKARNTAICEEISKALKKNGVPLEKDNASVIRIEGLIGQDHSVEAITIKTSMRGRHPKRIIMDDPVTDEDVSAKMRATVKRRYDEAFKLCSNIVIIGQPAHFDDLYALLRDRIKTLLVPHGTIPELDADLHAMKLAGVDETSIEMSYNLRVPKNGAAPFSNIKFVDDFPEGDSVAFIDPSDGGDYTSLTIMRGYFSGVAVQGHAWQRAWYHCLDEIVQICQKRGVRRLAFETNKFGREPVERLQGLLAPLHIGVQDIHSTTNKESGILAAGSYAHQIHLSKTSDNVYTNQVTKYDRDAEYDDCPDGLARSLIWLGLLDATKLKGKT